MHPESLCEAFHAFVPTTPIATCLLLSPPVAVSVPRMPCAPLLFFFYRHGIHCVHRGLHAWRSPYRRRYPSILNVLYPSIGPVLVVLTVFVCYIAHLFTAHLPDVSGIRWPCGKEYAADVVVRSLYMVAASTRMRIVYGRPPPAPRTCNVQ